jgi:hypothetical protein
MAATNEDPKTPVLPLAENSQTKRGAVEETESGDSGIKLLGVIKHFLLDGIPPFYHVLSHYAKIRRRYWMDVQQTYKIDNDNADITFHFKVGSIFKWLLDHICYTLDIIVRIGGVIFMFLVLFTLLLALIKLLDVTSYYTSLLHAFSKRI